MHLTKEQLVDAAEGTLLPSQLPHLAGCDRCQRDLADLRSALSAVSDAASPVPAPSSLFWAQLRRQIDERLASSDRRVGWTSWVQGDANWAFRPAVLLTAAACAALALALRLGMTAPPPATPRTGAPSETTIRTGRPEADMRAELLDDRALVDDPSLQLVAALTTTIDLDAARDAGLVVAGSAEHAVTHMDDDELRELRRLLRQELGS
jgi:hypothetical protein